MHDRETSMTKSMSSQRRLLWSIGIIALVLFAVMQSILAGLEPNIVSLQLAFTPDAFRKVLGGHGNSRELAHTAAIFPLISRS